MMHSYVVHRRYIVVWWTEEWLKPLNRYVIRFRKLRSVENCSNKMWRYLYDMYLYNLYNMYHVKYYIVGTYAAILYTRTAVVRGILFERLSLFTRATSLLVPVQKQKSWTWCRTSLYACIRYDIIFTNVYARAVPIVTHCNTHTHTHAHIYIYRYYIRHTYIQSYRLELVNICRYSRI